MTDPSVTLRNFFLKPGELFVAEQPCVLSTLLGSCVAVTMYSRRIAVGAICHALLPSCNKTGRCDCPDRHRYVECAIRYMVREFVMRGTSVTAIEAKIFGGADMFQSGHGSTGVGSQNVAKAGEILVREGIRVVASDVGGLLGRKIVFHPHTGEVFLRRLDRLATRSEREAET